MAKDLRSFLCSPPTPSTTSPGGWDARRCFTSGCWAAMPGVTDVPMPMSGICRFHACVQIRKEYDGAGKIAALASDPFVKLVVVDEDVDIHNDAEVLWAIATRTQPDRDTFFSSSPSPPPPGWTRPRTRSGAGGRRTP